MISLGSATRHLRAATLASTALLTALGGGWAQSAAPAQAQAQALAAKATPAAAKVTTPPAGKAVAFDPTGAIAPPPMSVGAAPQARPTEAKPPETKPPETKPPVITGEIQGPQKPALNRAIRAAVLREAGDARRDPAEMRAVKRAVDAYYASRGDAPVWLDKGQWTVAARSAFQQLQGAPEDGLDLRDYRVYSLGQGPEASLALGDVALSEAVAAYAFQASGGRVDPARISKLIGSRPAVVTAARALDETAKAADAGGLLQSYNPPDAGYVALREKLAALRAKPSAVALLAPTGRRRRASDASSGLATQRNARLEDEILVNMEFWRWQPRDLGADRLMVNIPEFTARLYRDNALAMSTRVIVGKPDKQTPLFSDKIEYLIVNPSWNVPQSIIKNELMDKLGELRRQGYDVEYIDGRLHVRQPPGERNALGRIKFIFPNDYAVYLHDTPTRNLFKASVRDFSHGCVRVDDPFKLAVSLLRPERGWSEERLEKMFGPHERRVALPAPMPIHLVYFTLSVDPNGELRHFQDVYGYAGKARAILGLGASDEAPQRESWRG